MVSFFSNAASSWLVERIPVHQKGPALQEGLWCDICWQELPHGFLQQRQTLYLQWMTCGGKIPATTLTFSETPTEASLTVTYAKVPREECQPWWWPTGSCVISLVRRMNRKHSITGTEVARALRPQDSKTCAYVVLERPGSAHSWHYCIRVIT